MNDPILTHLTRHKKFRTYNPPLKADINLNWIRMETIQHRWLPILVILTFFFCQSVQADTTGEITDLSIEQLMNLEITSVSKKSEKLSDSPAAVFAITQEDIRRSGVTSIPDALRMVPGLHVGRIDSNKWAVSSRGFNGRYANKLLVMIDGRSVYTPTFSGIYWDQNDVMLEDIERIEVIRGPGGTLWGANAVNGVINIITKHTSETQGGLFTIGGGTHEHGFGAARYGVKLGNNSYGRVYIKGLKRGEYKHTTLNDAGDNWNMVQGGFRMDSQFTRRDALTLSGDIYKGDVNQKPHLPLLTPPYFEDPNDNVKTFGGNFLGRWQHTFSAVSDLSLQAYFNHYNRKESFIDQELNTFDLDFQHRFTLAGRNDILWGLGYRYTTDAYSSRFTTTFNPDSRNDHLFSAFLQDEITLIDNYLRLTLGAKFEHNDYSGFEIQPSARILWTPHSRHKLWASVSRAVRTPSRTEHDLDSTSTVIPPSGPNSPLPIRINAQGSHDFKSEELLAFEVGYRIIPFDSLSLDFTAFYNIYDGVVGSGLGLPSFQGTYINIPLTLINDLDGETYGFELAALWRSTEWWIWHASYSYLKTQIGTQSPSPQHQVSLRSEMTFSNNINVDLWFRYQDNFKRLNAFSPEDFGIQNFITLDARLSWKPIKDLELSIVGQNLLESRHPEYLDEGYATPIVEIERGVYGKLLWKF
jgi:iron complex outermembrane receptor protein